jgi:hypothetical protein
MSMIDKERIAAVERLQAIGYTFDGADWQPPAAAHVSRPIAWAEADAVYAQLVLLADKLDGCAEGSLQERPCHACTSRQWSARVISPLRGSTKVFGEIHP